MSQTGPGEVVSVTQKGQATIPKQLREKFGIETPGEVFVYEDDGRIVVEPVPTIAELRGSLSTEEGSVLERVREWEADAETQEEQRTQRFIDRHTEE